MNICILTHTFPKYPNDTTAAFMHPLVLGIQRAGNSVTVLTPYHPELKKNLFPYPVRIYKYIWPDKLHVLGYSQTLRYGTHFRLSSWILAPLLMIQGIIALYKITKKEKFDIVSAHWIVPNGIIAAVVCAIKKIPFVITLPGSDVYVAQKNKFFAYLTRWAANHASTVCADSPQYLTELKKIQAHPLKKMVIPYPVDLTKIFPVTKKIELRKKLHIPDSAHILVIVGRLIEKKGFIYVIGALPEILHKFPKTKLVIVGEGEMKKFLISEANKLHVAHEISFVGNIERNQLRQFYSLADVIIVPSIVDSEGNIDDRPVVLLEAMACKRAVIVTNLPGNAMTVENGKSGILVPQKNSKSIAKAVIRILKTKKFQNQLANEAYTTIKEKFNHIKIGKIYSNLFHEITNL